MSRLLLIDTTAYLFRAYHAVFGADLRTGDNHPTGAIYGLINMLQKLRQQYPSSHIACVMDAPGKNFRHRLDPQYKANRSPMDDDLRVQIAPAQEFIAALGWRLISIADVEADDVIATLTKRARAADMEVVIAASDKDLMQLAGDGVVLYDGMRERLYDEAAVAERYGVTPAQMGDYLALIGDTADNIPGVNKVGAVTAAKWLKQYGNLDAIIADASAVKGVVGNHLRDAIAGGRLHLSRQLVELKTDVPVPETLSQLEAQSPDAAHWRELCERFEFRQLQQVFDKTLPLPSPASAARVKAEIITDASVLAAWAEKLRAAGEFAVDTETTGEPVMTAKLIGFSLATADAAAYVPLAHTDETVKQLTYDVALPLIRPILEDPSIRKILHNGKYDWHVFANYDIHLDGILEDTKIAAYADNSVIDSRLAALAKNHLSLDTIGYKDVVDGKKIKDFAAVPVDAAAAYAGEDAEVTHALYRQFVQQLPPRAATIYEELDRPLMPILAMIERAGVRIDGIELQRFAAAMRERMADLEGRAYALAGETFNLNSPRQLETLLFDKMGATTVHKTGGGARSTDERTLEKLANDYPLAKTLLEYRTLAKLVGTYADKLPRLQLAHTGRVHTTFSQTAVMSGRLSSSSPNLQNIPIRNEAGRRIRRAFIADSGYVLLAADYSQIELRLMAHIAGDEALSAAFRAGDDIHRQTASEVFGTPLAEVSEEQRRAAKAINFGLIYGMSAFGLARSLNIEQSQAKVYIERYFARYAQVAAYMEKIRHEAVELGHVETIFGRRIPLVPGRGGNAALQRVAINAPIQGSAADLVKKAMLRVCDWLREKRLRSRVILQVHDELVLEVAEDEIDIVRAEMPRLMNTAAPLSVPLAVDVKYGNNWDEAH